MYYPLYLYAYFAMILSDMLLGLAGFQINMKNAVFQVAADGPDRGSTHGNYFHFVDFSSFGFLFLFYFASKVHIYTTLTISLSDK